MEHLGCQEFGLQPGKKTSPTAAAAVAAADFRAGMWCSLEAAESVHYFEKLEPFGLALQLHQTLQRLRLLQLCQRPF